LRLSGAFVCVRSKRWFGLALRPTRHFPKRDFRELSRRMPLF
jgi:hypothetical protein